jgi:FkbM family methyltransferase
MFFDIGANVGNWSLANLQKTHKIIVVEASPTTFERLISNVSSNPNLICLNYAVCNSNEEYITFYNSTADTLSTINKEWHVSEKSRFYNQYAYQEIKCKTIKLDELIRQYGVPDLIKIDVEGGEYECISSLTQRVNQLCFEWASETNDITFKCIEHLIMLGYSKFSIQFQDNYTYRPSIYTDANSIRNILLQTTPKQEWGMVWTK